MSTEILFLRNRSEQHNLLYKSKICHLKIYDHVSPMSFFYGIIYCPISQWQFGHIQSVRSCYLAARKGSSVSTVGRTVVPCQWCKTIASPNKPALDSHVEKMKNDGSTNVM